MRVVFMQQRNFLERKKPFFWPQSGLKALALTLQPFALPLSPFLTLRLGDIAKAQPLLIGPLGL